ncbi:MAG TPA: hypothetical protein VN947_17720 [Polyangia bacterium]|nr:hypothetical protein [Polyangia bacterium]
MTTRLLLALSLVAAASGAAWADDSRVRTSATVEVIDDKAQIDDVISRLRAQQALDKQRHPSTLQQAGNLKIERVAPPTTATDTSHRPVGPEPKEQRPGSRRNSNEHGNLDHTERPKLKVHRR